MILCELFYVTLYEKFGYWPSLDSVFIHLFGREDIFLCVARKKFQTFLIKPNIYL